MAFQEFCCRSAGSNMNGGSLNSNAEPAAAAVYSATNGGWNSGTGVFTPTSGNPSATVTVGDFANVFLDGATTPVFIGRVTAVNTTTVTVSTTAANGTPPTTAGTGISINVGGAWKGPNGAVGFPLNFVTAALQNAAGNRPRINFKNDATYSITASISCAGNGNPVRYQGYTTTFGDLGRAIIDGGTTGASYFLVVVANSTGSFVDMIFQNNGATGANGGVQASNTNSSYHFWRCVVHDVRGSGFQASGNSNVLCMECEAYNCNQNNTVGLRSGFDNNTSQANVFSCLRCIAHNNSGSNTVGFHGCTTLIDCISDTNGAYGYYVSSGNSRVINCDAYNNGNDGFLSPLGSQATIYFENCNAVKNGGWGMNLANGGVLDLVVINCGFGSGTQANASGQITTSASSIVDISGSVTYAANVTPWNAPGTGDYRITLAAAKNAGRGSFTETAGGYTGSVAYPDIGAGQHLDSGGAPSGKIIGG